MSNQHIDVCDEEAEEFERQRLLDFLLPDDEKELLFLYRLMEPDQQHSTLSYVAESSKSCIDGSGYVEHIAKLLAGFPSTLLVNEVVRRNDCGIREMERQLNEVHKGELLNHVRCATTDNEIKEALDRQFDYGDPLHTIDDKIDTTRHIRKKFVYAPLFTGLGISAFLFEIGFVHYPFILKCLFCIVISAITWLFSFISTSALGFPYRNFSDSKEYHSVNKYLWIAFVIILLTISLLFPIHRSH